MTNSSSPLAPLADNSSIPPHRDSSPCQFKILCLRTGSDFCAHLPLNALTTTRYNQLHDPRREHEKHKHIPHTILPPPKKPSPSRMHTHTRSIPPPPLPSLPPFFFPTPLPKHSPTQAQTRHGTARHGMAKPKKRVRGGFAIVWEKGIDSTPRLCSFDFGIVNADAGREGLFVCLFVCSRGQELERIYRGRSTCIEETKDYFLGTGSRL
ncbi:hypothetical protein BDU57DRAFT_154157 [Ampelomyces quisqualis]|uniref:Uncharacterized protein n=1 Tax=Ampelomyces quisqualis TaxID=50730 RepID=A0A6A5QWN6_AMPQU|nr:hypothetical protein BDU57DRAFT_154157 [Ampelomyces quisqualis]